MRFQYKVWRSLKAACECSVADLSSQPDGRQRPRKTA